MKAVILAWTAAATLLTAQPPPRVSVQARFFPSLETMDGNWAALFSASDGKVYAGLANHGGSGHLVYYDGKTDRMHDAGSLNDLTGEAQVGRGPQSKIHAKFGEGKDGRISFGTHGGLWWNYSRYAAKEGYPGAHWMAYDPKTGRTEDFGLGVPNQGVNTGAYDPLFNRIDDQGYVYGSFGLGQLFRYDPRTDAIKELSCRVPIREKGISLGRDYNKSETAWRTVVWDTETHRFYGVEESATILFSFDPRAGKDGEIKRLGQLAIPAYADRRDVPYATLALTLGRDRRLYYGASAREFDYGGNATAATAHLITYDLKDGKMEDLGEMMLEDGSRVFGVNAADTGADGAIYMVGAVEHKPQPGKPVLAGGRIGKDYF